MADSHLEIEWASYDEEMNPVNWEQLPSIISTNVVPWLLDSKNPPSLGWVFIGCLLRRDRDAAVLGNPAAARARDGGGLVWIPAVLGESNWRGHH